MVNRLASSCPKRRAGRKKFKETRHPVYRGVRRRSNDRGGCELRAPNNKAAKRIWLGTYATPEMAARAHDVAALALKGGTASLNFADSATRVRVPSSGDVGEIQKAAAVEGEPARLENGGCVDEEAMPGVMRQMAQGMLMSPPRRWCDEMEDDVGGSSSSEVTLWSYSM